MTDTQPPPQNGEENNAGKNPFSPDTPTTSKKTPVQETSESAEQKLPPKKTEEKSPPPTSTGKKTGEKPVTAPSEELLEEEAELDHLEEEDDELLADQEGDVFWMAQQVIWNIIKIVFFLGLFSFILWAIWGPTWEGEKIKEKIKEVEKVVVPEKPPVKKEKPVAAPPLVKKEEKIPQPYLPPENRILELNEKFADWNKKSSILSATSWLARANSFFDIPASELIHSNVPQIRTAQINKIIQEVQLLIEYSEILQKKLVEEYTYFAEQSQTANQNSVLNEDAFFAALQQFDGSKIEIFLNQKANAEKQVVSNSVQASGRKMLLQNIQNYDTRLRSLHENIIANKQALIYNIQVVSFPGDSLEIILSPQEWRAGQQ